MGDLRHLLTILPDRVDYEFDCPICHEKIKLSVQKSIVSKQTRFPFEFMDVHGNPTHGLTFYIDKNWAIRGVDVIKNVNIQGDSIYNNIIPKKRGKISPMASQLGIVSQKEFEILKNIDEKNSIESIAKKMNQNPEDLYNTLQKLTQKGMISLESK
jgi:hypothetical protein